MPRLAILVAAMCLQPVAAQAQDPAYMLKQGQEKTEREFRASWVEKSTQADEFLRLGTQQNELVSSLAASIGISNATCSDSEMLSSEFKSLNEATGLQATYRDGLNSEREKYERETVSYSTISGYDAKMRKYSSLSGARLRYNLYSISSGPLSTMVKGLANNINAGCLARRIKASGRITDPKVIDALTNAERVSGLSVEIFSEDAGTYRTTVTFIARLGP